VVLERGRVTTVDEDKIYARVQEAADRHRERAADAWALAGRLAPYVAAACRGAVTAPLPINRFAAPLPTA
jgi:predicted FMN-binding regulatory protein PaiB